jgi:hypothetical protein
VCFAACCRQIFSPARLGQKEDIVLFEGAILDGRRRQAAAIKAGVEPRCRVFGSRAGDGNSALEFAFAVNYHRRDDLTVAEKTLAAAKYATAKRGFNQHAANAGNGQSAAPMISQKQAAAKFGVNEGSVSRAKAVLTKGVPDLVEAVRTEAVSIADAATIVNEPPAVQQKALKTVQAGKAPTLKAAVQKTAARKADDPAKIGRELAALIQRLERVDADNAKLRDLACEWLRKGLEFIEELTCTAAA